MKKVSLLLLLLLLISAYAGAQNQYQEVVYLKDGSTVRRYDHRTSAQRFAQNKNGRRQYLRLPHDGGGENYERTLPHAATRRLTAVFGQPRV